MARRVIRYQRDGINVAADLNVVVGTEGRTSSHSVSRVVQGPDEERRMSEQADIRPTTDELTPEEIDEESGEELPDREAMSLINANLAAPINAAVALNVLSDNSTAIANAEQTADIDQSIG
jgi:hypothetical protein